LKLRLPEKTFNLPTCNHLRSFAHCAYRTTHTAPRIAHLTPARPSARIEAETKPMKNRRTTPILIGFAVLLLAAGGVYLWGTVRLARHLQSAARDLQAQAAAGPDSMDLAEVADQVHRARLDAQALRARIRPLSPALRLLGGFPRYGPALAAIPPLADYGLALTTAGDELLTGFAPLWLSDEGEAQTAPLPARLLVTLQVARPNIAAAQGALATAVDARSQFELGDLPASLREPMERLDPLLEAGARALGMMDTLPTLLGAQAPQRYLLLAQNEDELRATGGFISAVGTVTIQSGEILDLEMQDSYDVDDLSQPYPPPPEPLQRYMLAGIWLVRDANWSPDFPTAAQKVEELYRFYDPTPVDGAIAFDQTAIERLLAAIGPVTPPGAPEPVTTDNVRAYMRAAWAPAPGGELSREWWEHRKDFIPSLGRAMLEKALGTADRAALFDLARAGLDLLQGKHLLLYLHAPEAARALADQGWDGSLQPGPADFLMAVDSNFGFNKVDPLIERSLDYTVDLRGAEAPTGEVKLTYHHTLETEVPCTHQASYGEGAYADMQKRCYWDYVRLYAPDGTTPLGGSLPPIPGDWLLSGEDEPGVWSKAEGVKGTTLFSGVLVLPAGDTASLQLRYALPENVLLAGPGGARVYLLRLAKQPGTEGVPVSVILLPPEGLQILEAEAWEQRADGSLRWEGVLDSDVELMVRFGPGW
jgi:hypothetical protein